MTIYVCWTGLEFISERWYLRACGSSHHHYSTLCIGRWILYETLDVHT